MSEEQDNQENSTPGDSLLKSDEVNKAVEAVQVSVPNPDKAEVKYSSPDSQNGDAKIDVENVRAAFAGMAKEELMRYANDPFWVRTRWILFALFWLLWLAMLVGAIAIIVLAPKCTAPKPRKWYEQSPMYEINVRSFKDGSRMADGVGDLEGITSKLEYIKSLGVKGVILSPIFATGAATSPESVEDFKNIHPDYGTIDEFKKLVAEMKSHDLHLILDLVPNHSGKQHKWFQDSIKKIPPYKDFYVWAPSKGLSDDRKNIPPNNWRSVEGGSAWEWNEERGEFYLHQFSVDQPDLNFRNPVVLDQFKDIMQFWMDLGVSGFHMRKTAFLLEDESLPDEQIGNKPGITHDTYDFFNHKHTANLHESLRLVGEWRAIVSNVSMNNILLVDDEFPLGDFAHVEEAANSTKVADDVLQTPKFLRSLPQTLNAADLEKHISRAIDSAPHKWPVWRLSGEGSSRLATRFSPGMADALMMTIMLLPGTPIVNYGDEIGMKDVPNSLNSSALGPMQWNSSSNAGFTSDSIKPWLQVGNPMVTNVASQVEVPESHLEIFKELVDARTTRAAVMLGETHFTVLNATQDNSTKTNNTTQNISGANSGLANCSVFAFTRIKSGNPGVLVAVNPTKVDCTVDFSTVPGIAEELTVHVRSVNIVSQELELRKKLPNGAIHLPSESGIVFTFVYKKE